jgi:plasmid stabilization system protein ParE
MDRGTGTGRKSSVPKVRWLPRALKDLERLYGFIHEKNPNAAIKALAFIKQSAITLETFPEIGAQCHQDRAFRDLFAPFDHGAYVLRYRIDKNQDVIITRV